MQQLIIGCGTIIYSNMYTNKKNNETVLGMIVNTNMTNNVIVEYPLDDLHEQVDATDFYKGTEISFLGSFKERFKKDDTTGEWKANGVKIQAQKIKIGKYFNVQVDGSFIDVSISKQVENKADDNITPESFMR